MRACGQVAPKEVVACSELVLFSEAWFFERAESEGDVFESNFSIYINLSGPVALEKTHGARMTRGDIPPYLMTRIRRRMSRQMGRRGKLFAKCVQRWRTSVCELVCYASDRPNPRRSRKEEEDGRETA